MPAEPATVAAFLADQSRGAEDRPPKAVATVMRYARSIGTDHKVRELESPVSHAAVKKVLRGIRMERGPAQKKKTAFTSEIASAVLAPLGGAAPLGAVRDRAIVLLGLMSAMRRSEIVALDVEDLIVNKRGLVIKIRRSKTDQEGEGRAVAVPIVEDSNFCAVRAIERWLSESKITVGALFRGLKKNGEVRSTRLGAQHVALAVKDAVGGKGNFSGHSLRSGYVTTAREEGIDWAPIMEQTGHKRLETVKGYTQYTPEVFDATKVADVFRGIGKRGPSTSSNSKTKK